MKKLFLPFFFGFALLSFGLSAQIKFAKSTNLLTPALHFSGSPIAVIDMNGDGLDDIVRLNQGVQLSVEYQTVPGEPFNHLSLGTVSNEGQWGMCAADIDNNGFPDILTGGAYDGISVAKANADGTSFNLAGLTGPGTFVQGVNFADINNDGWLDAFVCHDDGASRIFGNDGTGNLVYQPLWIDLATVPPSDNSGNYGSVWSDVDNDGDLDLYIAHCRQGVSDPADPVRINQLFLNNGDNTYTQDITNASGLRIGAQSWTADFGDIDNDGDFDCFITNHDVSSQLLENDGSGHFTDISVPSGIFNAVAATAIQGVFRDFDNDGYVDILVSGSGHFLFHNNGDKTFTEIADAFTGNEIESFAIGDLNNDGFQDVYAGYATPFNNPSSIPDILWFNEGNNNNYFGINLRGVQSNHNGVGAKVLLYSALGTQVREVRSGESYGIQNSMRLHFGLGQTAEIDSIVIFWPSGTVDVLNQSYALNQNITVEEGGCVTPHVTAYTDDPAVFCSGDSALIRVSGDYSAYLWSNGDTTAVISAKTGGDYRVVVTTPEGCTAVSNFVKIIVDPIEVPTITAAGDTIICAGNSIVLFASSASAYIWSTSDTTQSIEVSAPGLYTVTTQGLCNQFTSNVLNIKVLDNPAAAVTNDTVLAGMPATLTASGDQIQWYDAPSGGNLLASGGAFVTEPLDTTTTYWVANTTVYDEPNEFVGMVNHAGSNFGDVQANGAIIFNCLRPFRLSKVKVYTNTGAERKIDLRNVNGEVLTSKLVNIPSGTSVISLDFDIPVENNLSLTTDDAVNFNNLGTFGPQLRRSSEGVAYPYVIPNVVSLINSNLGPNRYYYFYNWEIDYYSYECTSERVPVTAKVDSIDATPEPGWAAGLRVFPNPTGGALRIELDDSSVQAGVMNVKNVQGATLQSRVFQSVSGKINLDADLSALPKGIYWLELAAEQGVARRKILLQ